MKAINIGIIKAVITKNLSNDFLAEGKLAQSQNKASKFLKVVSESPFLQLEYKVFDRLEKKSIPNDMAATRYIDSNLALFEEFTQNEVVSEHNKIKNFVDENIALIDDAKYDFYVALGDLIFETLNKTNPDVDIIHESFTTVLNHIKKDKEIVTEQTVSINIPKEVDGDQLIEIALKKFSEKYKTLNEDDMLLIKSIVLSNDKGRVSLFESLKKENLTVLESADKNGIEDKIHETVDKIKKMEYKNETSIKDIMSLYELKKNLI